MKLNNIFLVPTDFSEVCHNAIKTAVEIAGQINYKVCIYHVINKETASLFSKAENLETNVEEELNQLRNEFQASHKIDISIAFEKGSIFDLIHVKAEHIGANLIILGTHGKKGMQKLFGSFALKVISSANVPTLVVQKKSYAGFNNILLPINTFTEARQKVTQAISVANRFNSKIHLFKELVNEPADASRIEIISKQIQDALSKAGIEYTSVHAEKPGESAGLVVDYAVIHHIDLIMILTEPQIGSSYFSLGPWNEKIMFNEAQIPVICINPVEHGRVYFDM